MKIKVKGGACYEVIFDNDGTPAVCEISKDHAESLPKDSVWFIASSHFREYWADIQGAHHIVLTAVE